MRMGTYHMQWKHIQYTSRTVARFATTHFLTDIRLVYTSNYETLNLTAFITFPKHFTQILLVYKIHKNKIYSQNPVQGHLSSIAVCNQQGFECHLNFCNTGEGISVTANILNMGNVILIFQYHTKIWNNQRKHCFLTSCRNRCACGFQCLFYDTSFREVLVASNMCFMTHLSEIYIYQKYRKPFDCMWSKSWDWCYCKSAVGYMDQLQPVCASHFMTVWGPSENEALAPTVHP